MTDQGCVRDVLSKDYALSFDDEEVDQLLYIIEGGFESLFGDLVVSSWAD